MNWSMLTNETILHELITRDPVLESLFANESIREQLPKPDEPLKSGYAALLSAILGQRIRYTTAKRIRSKLYAVMQSVQYLPKDTMVQFPTHEAWMALGISSSMVITIKHAEAWCHERTLDTGHETWTMDDLAQAVRDKQLPGIGPWTIQTTILGTLHDLNAFPEKDVFLHARIQRLYNLDKSPTCKQVKTIASHWEPTRAIVCWWLWRWFD